MTTIKTERIYLSYVTLLDWAKRHLITHLTAVKFGKPRAQSPFYKLSTLFYKNALFNDLCISTQKLYQILTLQRKVQRALILGWLVVSKCLIQRIANWKAEHNGDQVIHFYGKALFCCYSRMVSPQWGCWERVWLNLKIRNWDTEMSESKRETQKLRESSQRRGTKYTKCLRERAGTEITGKDKRWIRMARKYPRGGGYKGGRNKSQCRRVNLHVLHSTMSRVKESHPLTLTCPG